MSWRTETSWHKHWGFIGTSSVNAVFFFFLTPVLYLAWVDVQADKGQIKDPSLSSVKVWGQVGHSWINRLLSVSSIDHYTVENRHNLSLEPINHAQRPGDLIPQAQVTKPVYLAAQTIHYVWGNAREGFPAWECVWICVNMGRRMIAQQITGTKEWGKCANRVYKWITINPLDQAGQILGVQLI